MSVTDEIKDRLDILEVIQGYVPLKKAGRSYKGLCPFHSEKTPSFVVFPESGTWHCFGACGIGGDIFSFVMKKENLDFGEALQLLARRAGVELAPRGSQADAAEQRLALLRDINEAAAVYFHNLLLASRSDEAARARAYLESRGLVPETVRQFQVGYALNQWEGLLQYLVGKKYHLADISEAGLIVEREERGEGDSRTGYFDRFRGRILFPIREAQGRTIGFGGRVLDAGVPKYLNSPQTPIFDKSAVLFGLDHARQGIRITGEAVIVEGYMDVLMAHQHGITNVVAQMGTALTERQLEQIKRYTRRFVLALDSDVAGDQATLRGLDVARQVADREIVPVPTPWGLIQFEERLAAELRIASLPPGKDPDEVIRESPAVWAQLVAGAKPVMDYYFEVLTRDLDLGTARGKAEAVHVLGPLVVEVGDRVQRTHYLQRLARMVQLDERILWQQIQQATGQKRPARSSAARVAEPGPGVGAAVESGPWGLDEHCLSFVLCYPNFLKESDDLLRVSDEEPLRADDLSRPEDRAILEAWRRWLAAGGTGEVRAGFFDLLEEPLQKRLAGLVQLRMGDPPAPDTLLKEEVMDAITRLRLRTLRQQNLELRFLHEEAHASRDRETLREYGRLNGAVVVRIHRLEKALNARSMSGRRRLEDSTIRIPLVEP